MKTKLVLLTLLCTAPYIAAAQDIEGRVSKLEQQINQLIKASRKNTETLNRLADKLGQQQGMPQEKSEKYDNDNDDE